MCLTDILLVILSGQPPSLNWPVRKDPSKQNVQSSCRNLCVKEAQLWTTVPTTKPYTVSRYIRLLS